MIKFGSRTELYVPRGDDYEITARLGQRVRGGLSAVLLRRRNLAAAQARDVVLEIGTMLANRAQEVPPLGPREGGRALSAARSDRDARASDRR